MKKSSAWALVFFILIVLAAGIYSILWWTTARQMSVQIDHIWSGLSKGGTTVEGVKPEVRGFPFYPEVTFKGVITEENGTIWTFPELTYRGFPIQGFAQAILTPQGFSIQGPLFPMPLTADQGYIYFTLPLDFPSNTKIETLRAWQAGGHQIPISGLYLKSAELNILGQGFLTLDDQLQPAGEFNTRISGMGALLTDLTARGILKEGSANMAQSFLTALSQTDLVTGEQFFMTQIKIQKRGLFFGPLRIGYIPEVVWSDRKDSPTQ